MATTDGETAQPRSQSAALSGRARGVMIGALIGFAWAAYGASGIASGARYGVIAVAVAITAALVAAAVAMRRLARTLPPATAAQRVAGRRVQILFWLNLLAEIVLLNIAVALLPTPFLRLFWIPAISAVVGLHFWPMAAFFRVRSYWWVGAAMIAVAAVVAVLVARHPLDAAALTHGEALANALILWSAVAAGAAFALTGPRQARP